MAKTPEERPEGATAAVTTDSPVGVPAASSGPPTVKVNGRRIRYNPDPGYRVLVAYVTDYGERLPVPNMKAFGPAQPGMTDQAEYLLLRPKPSNAKHGDWWREATAEELALYQEETGAFGTGPFAAELRAEWKARHPEYREGPPPLPTTAGEEVLRKLANALDKREGGQR